MNSNTLISVKLAIGRKIPYSLLEGIKAMKYTSWETIWVI